MTARIRTSMEEEQGFTLIELLVIIVIIGILAAIAISTLISQRKSAVDSSMRSDLRNVAVIIESYQAEHEDYPGAWADIAADVRKDADTTITLTVDPDGSAYCLFATRAAGASPGSATWSYDSDGGGLLDGGVACG